MAVQRICWVFIQLLALIIPSTTATWGAPSALTRNVPRLLAISRDSVRIPSNQAICVLGIRGGEIEISSDKEDGLVMEKTRNAVRSILKIGDRNIPFASKLLRSCLATVESMTGIRLLPPKKRRKSSKKSKIMATTDEEQETEGEAEVQVKKKKSTKSSSATKKHLTAAIKSTNPNYRIQRELKVFIKSPPPNLSVQVGSNLRVWIVTMVGANNTIYEGEVFKLRVSFPTQYPTVPPSVYFLQGHIPTHEHVYTNGDICLSLLGKDWRPTMTAQSIAVSILSILSSAQSKSLPMDNARHAGSKPGEYQKDWVYHDDNC